MNLIDMTQFLPIKPSESKICLPVGSYDKNTAEDGRNCYIAEKRIVSKPL